MSAQRLKLRGLRTSDEADFLRARDMIVAEGFEFGIDYRSGMDWDDYLQRVSNNAIGVDLPEEAVPNTALFADVEGTIVGWASIRHELNRFLARYGGHIGYAVLPDHRRQGYGTAILKQSIDIAHAIGIEEVLVTCDETNVGSVCVIDACGGQLETTVQMPGREVPRLRYWFN